MCSSPQNKTTPMIVNPISNNTGKGLNSILKNQREKPNTNVAKCCGYTQETPNFERRENFRTCQKGRQTTWVYPLIMTTLAEVKARKIHFDSCTQCFEFIEDWIFSSHGLKAMEWTNYITVVAMSTDKSKPRDRFSPITTADFVMRMLVAY